MSLKEAAKYLETQGRGNDSRLMHVTPSELQGLQALAMAKGGSLTINPQTGLPEAGFLEDILPVAAAGAAMYFAPPLAGAIGGAFGASGALATGIGAGLLAGGTSLLTQALSGQPVNIGKAATTGALTGLTAGAFAPSTNALTETPALELAKQTANAPIVQGDFSTAPLTLPSAQPPQLGANPTASEYAAWDKYLGTDQVPAGPAKTGNWFSDLSGKEKLGIGLGGTALLSLLGSQNQQKIQAPSTSTSYIRPYTYSQTRNPNWGQPGQSYYNQSYTAQPIYQAAQGGLMAIGGPVEDMSQHNVGKNIYPMSTIDASAYSTPFQTPIGTSVISSQYEPKTNPFTGEPVGMAAGGSANSGYIPTSQAVQDYNKMLSDRAAEEYLRNPMPSALMPASQRPAIMPTDRPTILPYYGDASQSPVAQAGLPQYTYDARTQKYTQLPYQAPAVQQPVAAAPILDTSSGGGKAGGMMPSNLRFDRGGKTEADNMFEGLSEKEKKAVILDLMTQSLKPMPGAEYTGMMNAPQGMFGRVGASKELDDNSKVRAGLSGIAMAVPGQQGVKTMPGSMDIGYTTARNSDYDPYLDLSAYRSINPMPGRGHAQGVNAKYTVPFVQGGQAGYNLGGYSDGGRLLKGPGDGMSDNIPASIGDKQPARLADGEFVVPADVVSHLGNGSTDAGAKKLYAMMDKVRTARVGNKKQGKQIKAEKYLPK